MISLPAVEAVLLQKYGKDDEVAIALEAKEYQDGSVKFVIFSIVPLNITEINTYLRNQGVSNLVTVSDLILLDTIPLL
jgi:non-ribosomal peptide synthetase component E (peptide arylation enzyme)